MTWSLADAARDAPGRAAWILGGKAVTYAELAARVSLRRAWLRDAGYPRETPLAVVGASDAETLLFLLGCIDVGQAVALVHPRLTGGERERVVRVVEPTGTVFTVPTWNDGGGVSGWTSAKPARTPASFSGAVANDGGIDPERCLAILFTSGTTGAPKGVSLSRRAFEASAQASGRNLPLGAEDRWLLGLPVAHVGGLSILTRSLLARSTVVVPEAVLRGERLTAEALRRTLEWDGVTLASLVPTQLEWLLADADFRPPASLRAVLLGGAAARPALLARAADRGLPVLTTYGLTEACSQVTTQTYGTVNRGERGSGKPMEGVDVRLLEGGAIAVRGPTLFTHYVTASGVAASKDAEGYFHTDDIGRFDAEGQLHVLARRTDMIVTGGENVFPAEVEAVLEECPGVAAACVFGLTDDTWGELVAVAIVASPDGAPSLDALREFAAKRLASHRRPRRAAFMTAFDVAPSGKLDRAATRARALPLLEAM